jgi:hypothetical protein
MTDNSQSEGDPARVVLMELFDRLDADGGLLLSATAVEDIPFHQTKELAGRTRLPANQILNLKRRIMRHLQLIMRSHKGEGGMT